MLITTVITWYAQLSPNALGLDSACGEIGRDTLTVVSLKVYLPIMRRAGSPAVSSTPTELREFSVISQRSTDNRNHLATPVLAIQRDERRHRSV